MYTTLPYDKMNDQVREDRARPPVLSECQADSSCDNIHELVAAEHGLYYVRPLFISIYIFICVAWAPTFCGLVCVWSSDNEEVVLHHNFHSQKLFHCRTPGESGCLNGGTCDFATGKCNCQDGFEGHDCGLETAAKCPPDVDSPCGEFGTCYGDTRQCYCQYAYIGETCNVPRVFTDCMGTGLLMEVSVPEAFIGEISMKKDGNDEIVNHVATPECTFNEEASDVPGFKKLVYTLPFDGSGECDNASLTVHDDKPDANDITYETAAVQTFSKIVVTQLDHYLVFLCTHKASNFTMFAKLDAVKLDEKDNLRKKETDKTYSPVRFSVNDDKGEPLTKALFVGDPFSLFFYLNDDSVYKALRIEVCTANDTSGAKPVVFKFIDQGCPTIEAGSIMQDPYGQVLTTYSAPEGATTPASRLDLLAFKFKSGPNVGFNCKVKICKAGDEAACNPGCGRPEEAPTEAGSLAPGNEAGAGGEAAGTEGGGEGGTTVEVGGTVEGAVRRRRKRRSSGTELEETFSAILQVVDPSEEAQKELIIRTQKDKPQPKAPTSSECFRSEDILIVIVVMSALVFILLVACFVLSISIIRARNRVIKYDDNSGSSSPRFFIPRAIVKA
ncbi:hypothetical protein FSP39_016753 [Pinctada imbricata]|uniref:Uncharacterized protein n=1 Tax=Pinctada imbricata TaxID=66713 RepID=A0AA89C2J9_PINIB|nr:hypothetical protein FSP39_016753 [Pinctada imbricata]